jgi:hypothetical protein
MANRVDNGQRRKKMFGYVSNCDLKVKPGAGISESQNRKHMDKLKLLVLAGISTLAVSQASASLIVNGDFQAGNTGFGSDYISSPSQGIGTDAGTYDVVNDPYGSPPPQNPYIHPPGYYDHTFGTADGLMLAVNGATDPSFRAWYETLGGLTIGQKYSFSFWLSNWSFDPVANLQLKIGIGGFQQGGILAPETPNTWVNENVLWTATSTSAEFAIYDLQTAAGGNDFALDDISLTAVPTAVPEASTMFAGVMMLLPFGLSAARIMRKKTLT